MPRPGTRSGRARSPLRWSTARWIAVLVGVNLLWRTVRYALGFPIWGDEAFIAINLAQRGLAELAAPLDHDQIAPLLFLWGEWGVARLLGWSEWALRLPPFLAGAASAVLFALLARSLLSRHAAMAAIGVFAASYYPVRHATELKPYAVDLLVSVAILLLGAGVVRSPRSAGRVAAFAAVAAAGAWASYPSIFIAGGVLLVAGVRALRARSAAGVAAAGAAAAVIGGSFAAMYLLVGARQAAAGAWLTDSAHWAFTFPPVTEPWRLPGWFIAVHTGRMLAYPNGGGSGGSTFTFVLCLAGAAALWRRDRATLALLLAPFLLMFVAAALRKYPYGGSARVTQHLAPIICALAGAGLVTTLRLVFTPRRTHGMLRVAMIVFLVMAAAGIARDVAEPFKKTADLENRRVIRALAERAAPGDRWIMFADTAANPHVPDVSGWGGSAARTRFNVFRFAPEGVDVRWGPAPDAVERAEDRALVLIVYHDNRVPFPEQRLGRYLSAMERRFGPPSRESFELHDRDEKIVVYGY